MNKSAKKYYHDLKMFIPVKGNNESRFLNDIKIRLEELCEFSSNITYTQICDELGNPNELASEYFSNVDSEYIIKKLRISQYVRCLIICLISAIIIATGVRSYYLHQLYLEVQDSIVTEKTVIIE